MRLPSGSTLFPYTTLFRSEELLARVRVALRQGAPVVAGPVVATAAFTVDLGAKRVHDAAGTVVRLTPTEWGLLEILARQAGRDRKSTRLNSSHSQISYAVF